MATRLAAGLAGLCLALSFSGCAVKSAATAQPDQPEPVRGRPTGTTPEPSGPLSAPQTTAELPPEQEIPDGAAPPPRPLVPPPVAEAPVTTPRPDRSPRPQPTPAPQPPVEPVETVERPELPQLGPILSDQERRAYNQEIDAGVLAVRTLLQTVTARRLDADQSAAVKRIRAFVTQAQETRDQDLARSRNLTERARLLAEDLERSTR